MSYYTHTPLGNFENDTTACFDCIVMNFALSLFKIWGAPAPPLWMWEQTLYNIEHCVKTGLGISTNKYKYTVDSPIIGPWQGSTGSNSSATNISTPLLRVMDFWSNGISYTSYNLKHKYHIKFKMLFDNNTTSSKKFLKWLQTKPPPHEIVSLLKHDAQTWESCFWTSGGLLNLKKCLYYIMAWEFDDKGYATLIPSDCLPSIRLSSGNINQWSTIQHFDSTTSHKTLGNHMAPSLQMTSSLSALKKRVQHYSTHITTSSLTRQK